jgi:hypothetical protein
LDIRGTLHSEAYLDRDLLLFDGKANQVVYVPPRTQDGHPAYRRRPAEGARMGQCQSA